MNTLITMKTQALIAVFLSFLTASAVSGEIVDIIVSDDVNEEETSQEDLRQMLNGEVTSWQDNKRIKIVMQALPDCYVEKWMPANRTDACASNNRAPVDSVTCELLQESRSDFDARWIDLNYREKTPDLPEWIKPNKLADVLKRANHAMAFVCNDATKTLKKVKALKVGNPVQIDPSDWCPLRTATQTLESLTLKGHEGEVTSVAFAPDPDGINSASGKITLASASWDNSVRIWTFDGQRWSGGEPLTGHQRRVTSVAFAPDAKTLASGSGDGTVRLWKLDGQRWRQLGEPLQGHKGPVTSVAFAPPDGKILASGSSDDTVRLWPLREDGTVGPGDPLVLKGHKGTVTSVAFAPDGKTLASASDSVRLWRLDGPGGTPTDKPQVLKGHDLLKEVTSVAFAADGTLASGSNDHSVRLWQLDNNGIMQPGELLNGHKDNVTSVAFAPDGKTLASGSKDNTVRLWQLDDQGAHCGEVLKDDDDKNNNVKLNGVAFAPDGKTVASALGSRENSVTVRLWEPVKD